MNAVSRVTTLPDEEILGREARRILRRLCEAGAVLVLAPELGKAAVLRQRDTEELPPVRTAVVERDVAQAFALRDWIACESKGKIARYKITNAGRAALKRYLAEDAEARRREFDPATTPFMAQHLEWGERTMPDAEGKPHTKRVNVAESPLTMLSRRKGGDGKPFLNADLVQAGERFREDFELAHIGPRVAQNWERFMTASDRGSFSSGGGEGSEAARARVHDALQDLGPGLGDIIMRCCCFLEGLEAAEKRMGWSARSGKVVLRIALQRLHRHYVEKHGSVSAILS